MRGEERNTSLQRIDRDGLILKIRRVIQNLEKVPADLLHPTKVKLGIYGPVKELKEAGEGWREDREPMRAGLCKVLNGAQDWTRTSMLLALAPETSASTNSATWARKAL